MRPIEEPAVLRRLTPHMRISGWGERAALGNNHRLFFAASFNPGLNDPKRLSERALAGRGGQGTGAAGPQLLILPTEQFSGCLRALPHPLVQPLSLRRRPR